MKKAFLFIIFIVFSFNQLQAQEKLSDIAKIATFAKVYGFLKYYHPVVAKGNYNWDQVFIDKLPEVLNTTDGPSLSAFYSNWIDSLGEVEACTTCHTTYEFFDKNFNLSWTQSLSVFDQKLRDQLKYIEENRVQGEQHYVATQSVGQIKITNEPKYTDFDYPTADYRLLGFIKYWNIIEYFFPYKYLADQNWDEVLIEMIPKFRQASNQEEYRNAIRELIAHLDDSHARVIFESSQPNYLPVKISNIDNQAVISAYFNDSIAHLNNLKMGDIIVEINGLNIQDEKDRLAKYYSGSNANAKSESIYYDLLKGESNTVALTVKRADETLSLTANRYAPDDFNFYDNPKALKSKVINNDIGYMDMANIKAKDLLEILDSFQDKKAIIIDLRNYPEFIYSLFGRYLNSESRAFSSTFRPYILYPGRFSKPKNISMRGGKSTFKGKVIILVNSESVSRAEFTAMAFQTADNAITIGNQTTGADGDVSVFQYMGGYTTTMSGNGIAYPDGTESQRKGVKIDILVKPTIAGLRKGIDEVLAKAIEIASN